MLTRTIFCLNIAEKKHTYCEQIESASAELRTKTSPRQWKPLSM